VARRGLTGALLLGGASTRFGSPKALAQLGGETLAERAWRVLGELTDDRIAVGKIADGLDLPFPLTDDESDVRAPIAGVVAALRAASHDNCVVLPVDCPLVTPAMLAALADACEGSIDVAVPQTGPLPGAYRARTLAALERALTAGELSLRSVLAELSVSVVACDARLLANVNTPDELLRLRSV
jgi:molybdopterin-guanine dinucleotide biosynthesis protein A